MCGRITLRHPNRAILAFLREATGEVPVPGFNLGPGTERLIVRRKNGNGSGREAVFLRWGFVPAWSREEKPAGIVNARAETVAEKPSFREAFRKRRCLVPADGFYEWRREEGRRQPFFFSLPEDRPFALAGIWEERRREDEVSQTFCLLTTEANELMAPIHDRMPAMLDEAAAEIWLGAESERNAAEVLRAFPSERMVVRPVSSFVNKIGNEGPDCLTPPEDSREQLSLF